MKKLGWIIICMLLVFALPVQGMTLYYDGQLHEYEETVTLLVNGSPLNLDVPPVIIQDRTLVPTRGLFESLGARVEWKPSTRQVVVTATGTEVVLTVDRREATVNGQQVTMDVPAKIINDRTMIPVRFVSEQLGLTVGWNGVTKTVSVSHNWDYTVTDLIYYEADHRLTIEADEPIQAVEEQVLSENGVWRTVLNFPGAKMKMGTKTLQTNSQQLTEIRCAQYRLLPYIGRVVLESTVKLTYNLTYSQDRKTLTVEIGFTDQPTPAPTPTPTPTPAPVQDGDIPALNPAARDLLVVIDPGHGGSDVGSVGKENGQAVLYEKDVNLAIANRANALLTAAGVKTHMTRSTDVAVDLFERPEIGNRLGAALFMSVHNNAFTSENAHGTTVLYYPDGEPAPGQMTSYRFAQILQEELVSALGRYDRGLTDGAEMVVIRKAQMPSVITEIAFVTNPTERQLLMSEEFQQKAAKALCIAVIRALNEVTQA